MKKIFFALLCISILTISAILPALAAPIEDDGRYEVSVVLWHAEDDKTSFGNSYILPTAIIEKSGESTTITITTNENVRNFRVWYYTDGSVEGSTADAEKVTDVLIAGKIYSEGYRFPLMTDSEFSGLKFRASIMPMSPSARLKIDYASAVSAPVSEPEPQTEAPTVPSPTTEVTVPDEIEEDAGDIIEDISEHTTEDELTYEDISEYEPEDEDISETEEISTAAQDELDENSDSPSSVKYVIISAIALACIAGLAALIIIKKRS